MLSYIFSTDTTSTDPAQVEIFKNVLTSIKTYDTSALKPIEIFEHPAAFEQPVPTQRPTTAGSPTLNPLAPEFHPDTPPMELARSPFPFVNPEFEKNLKECWDKHKLAHESDTDINPPSPNNDSSDSPYEWGSYCGYQVDQAATEAAAENEADDICYADEQATHRAQEYADMKRADDGYDDYANYDPIADEPFITDNETDDEDYEYFNNTYWKAMESAHLCPDCQSEEGLESEEVMGSSESDGSDDFGATEPISDYDFSTYSQADLAIRCRRLHEQIDYNRVVNRGHDNRATQYNTYYTILTTLVALVAKTGMLMYVFKYADDDAFVKFIGKIATGVLSWELIDAVIQQLTRSRFFTGLSHMLLTPTFDVFKDTGPEVKY
jgi:hypothetical protein